jgi:hypothetical protein
MESAKSIARNTRLNVVQADSTGIRVNDAMATLLGLTSSQTQQLNEAVGTFITRLQAEELRYAYVTVNTDGSEEIVVPPFDRTKTIETLRAELSSHLSPQIAELVEERIRFDPTLAVGNREMRAYIETGNDGATREVFVRKVETGPTTFEGKEFFSVQTLRSHALVRGEYRFRTRHLFTAIDQLPRKAAPVDTNVTSTRTRPTKEAK